MSGIESPWLGADTAALSWEVDGSPRSTHFDDVYYTSHNGLAESRHVFLAGNDLPQRWQQAELEIFTIAETGFGTGLNFLTTLQAWLTSAPAHQQLHYIAIEKHPLLAEQLQRSLQCWPELQELGDTLLRNYPPPLPGQHCLLLMSGRVRLDLHFADVEEVLARLAELPNLQIDSWYLDGFSPARNPAMWTETVYAGMANLSHPGTHLATFSVAGDVRRGLQAAGFSMEKCAGHGRKREMLRGTCTTTPTPPAPRTTPWHISPSPPSAARSAIVVGAGLAGASVAAALARRGWSVTVLEQAETASAASGNAQGILYTRVSHRASPLNDFALHSFCFASRFYAELLSNGQLEEGRDGQLCGALHLSARSVEKHPLLATVASLPGLVAYLDPDGAAQVSGLSSCSGGLYYPRAGWMHPPAVCRALLMNPAIQLQQHAPVASLKLVDGQWLAHNSDDVELARADIAIVACGGGSNQFAGLEWMPLQHIRGQVSQIASPAGLQALRTVICHDGYLAPARDGEHCIGASFDLDDNDPQPRVGDHADNLHKLAAALPQLTAALQQIDVDGVTGRVGFRTASPDYLPMVGAVPEMPRFCEDYAALRKNARRLVPNTGSYLPGLYVSTAHGSRGLTSTPLTAELLAAQINGEPWPVDSSLYRALAPARFIIRDLVRNRL